MFQAEGPTYMEPPRLEDTFVLRSSNKTILKSQSSWNIVNERKDGKKWGWKNRQGQDHIGLCR